MPSISAFRGIRYDLGHVGSLSDVVAPPYDVIDASLQAALYKRHPANVVRLILNRDEPGDDDRSNRYTRAGRFLRNWLREGVLFTESAGAIYAYNQEFDVEGRRHTRRGFMCRVRLEPFGEGRIYPHEETHSRAKADRLKLWTTCRANLSQIFGLYPDEENAAQRILDSAVMTATPLEATDHLGVMHRMWPVTDISVSTAITAAMADKPIYIADGHHRYETALAYRDELARASGGLSPEHPANFVLMMCVSMSDPGLLVLPTHRLFRGLWPISSGQLIEKLSNDFCAEALDYGAGEAADVWEELEMEGNQGCLAFFTAEDQRWVRAEITEAGKKKMGQLAPEHSSEWQRLGVSILHRLVVDTLLRSEERGARSEEKVPKFPASGSQIPAPKYVHSIDEVLDGLKHGDAAGRDATGQQGSGGRFELAALVMPATVDHIRSISGHGERMPAKSTYFYPKLLSGLVINPLE